MEKYQNESMKKNEMKSNKQNEKIIKCELIGCASVYYFLFTKHINIVADAISLFK